MKEFNLKGTLKEACGKKAAKLLRKEGLVPCNIYGELKDENGLPKATAFTIPATDLRKAIYTPHVYVFNIDIEGKNHTAIIKELQFEPVTDQLQHIDFYEVTEKKPVTVGIPVKLNGLAQGVRDGGKLVLQIRKINVTAPYKNIPEILNIDVTNLRLGKSIKIEELSFEGLEIATPKDVVVCSVKMTRQAASAAAAAAATETTEEQ
jgi:large subunit ribosomal protein L25